MFTTPDLPVELWIEILSYLPRTALHKLIGVNRFLFELALDDIYEELRFIENDKETEKIFLQMEFVFLSFFVYSHFKSWLKVSKYRKARETTPHSTNVSSCHGFRRSRKQCTIFEDPIDKQATLTVALEPPQI